MQSTVLVKDIIKNGAGRVSDNLSCGGGGEEKVHFVCLIMIGNYPDYDNMIFSEVVEKVSINY